nr:sulfotransferase [uncultured Draconibacterium sp.]
MKINTGLGIKRTIENYTNFIKTTIKQDKTKVFGIGRNKTGTTSLKKAMKDLGYVVGNQRTAELLFDDWANNNYDPIISYCRTAQFFQDAPFSLPKTYKFLDEAFPNSKFILTVRNSSEEWYNSLIRFHAKLWGKNGRIPTKEDLMNANYIYKGRPWHVKRVTGITPEHDPYNKEKLIDHYEDYNTNVVDYFKNRPDDLLVLNVAEEGAYKKLTDFLGIQTLSDEFPWENKT